MERPPGVGVQPPRLEGEVRGERPRLPSPDSPTEDRQPKCTLFKATPSKVPSRSMRAAVCTGLLTQGVCPVCGVVVVIASASRQALNSVTTGRSLSDRYAATANRIEEWTAKNCVGARGVGVTSLLLHVVVALPTRGARSPQLALCRHHTTVLLTQNSPRLCFAARLSTDVATVGPPH